MGKAYTNMPRAWNLFRYAQIKIKLKANSVTSPKSNSGNVWHTSSHAHIHIHTCRLLGWNEYVIEIWHCAANPRQDLLALSVTLSHSVSHSVCLSAYLLTKELSLCLSGRIVLNGDFLCNHLIIHQFPKKPERGYIPTLCWRARQWETGERKGRVSWRKWSKWILALLPAYTYLHGLVLMLSPSHFPLSHLPLTDWAFTYNIIFSLVSSSASCILNVWESISSHAFA